jgi:uncharacterized coiled-coil protein SlyX
MNPLIQFKMITLPALIAVTFACFAFLPKAQAVSPAPDGGYPNGNTAEGALALQFLTTGTFNTALGNGALFSNGAGVQNTATGAGALLKNTANDNTATGAGALQNNTLGTHNTAVGLGALFSNIGASDNTAVGWEALASNIGLGNTAVGSRALLSNVGGGNNTATGSRALENHNTGNANTATGVEALFHNTDGDTNTAIGFGALFNTTGNNNIGLGFDAGDNLTMGDNNIDIGNVGVAGESNTIRIGRLVHTATFIAGISGQTASGGVAVFVNADGKLGTSNSSARFKDEIKPMDNASEAILALKPVTFRYKKEFDPKGSPQFGLVAEDVEKVNPDLVARDTKGEVYTVRYEAVNAMLLNEFLKQHRKVEEHHYKVEQHHRKAQEQDATVAQLESTVAKQGATIAEQQKQIEVLTSGLQKVSAQVEVSKPAPQTVANNQ